MDAGGRTTQEQLSDARSQPRGFVHTSLSARYAKSPLRVLSMDLEVA